MTARFGLVVPPANPTVEPEIGALLAGAGPVHTARFPAHPGAGLEARLDLYNRDLPAALESLAGLGPAAVLVACTGSSYRLGPAGDEALRARLGARFGFPVLTAAAAIAWVLARLGAARVAVVSPYPAWLTAQSVAYWSEAGVEVVAEVAVPGSGAIYDLGPEAMAAPLEAAAGSRPEAVVVTGTGAPSLDALDALAPSSPVPLLSSNLCSAAALMDAAGPGGRPPASPRPSLARLLPLLAAGGAVR